MSPEVRITPDGTRIAWRFDTADEWGTNEYSNVVAWISDAKVADWIPLIPDPAFAPDRTTCPWCGRTARKLTASGRIRKHVANPGAEPWPPPCAGTGRRPSEYTGAVPE
jgi:hypothetical protein